MLRTRQGLRARVLSIALFAVLTVPASAQAQDVFRGKTISVYIGFGPGGTYDFYGRLVARYLGQHIAGNPTVVPVQMPGAGSFTCANFMFSVAPKDGTALATLTQTLAIEELLGTPGVNYKATQFNWIGRATSIVETQFTYGRTKTHSMDEATQFETLMGTTGVGSPTEGYPKLLNAVYATKFKLIGPYPSTIEAILAAERGEVDGSLTTFQTIRTARPEWVREKKVFVLVQYSAKRTAELPDVPAFPEFGKTAFDRQMLEFYVSAEQVGRSFVAPPGVAADRVAILRRGFEDMLKDPGLLAEIEKLKAEFAPLAGEPLQRQIEGVAHVSPDVVARMRAILH